jgi:hypothetical protein
MENQKYFISVKRIIRVSLQAIRMRRGESKNVLHEMHSFLRIRQGESTTITVPGSSDIKMVEEVGIFIPLFVCK